jgi:uncharacterized protein (TIGR02996 family)
MSAPHAEVSMSDEDALLQRIIDEPDVDGPRLVYADWLEEHGQEERAEFIRVQAELHRTPAGAPRQNELGAKARELLAARFGDWVGAFLEALERVPWLEHLGQPDPRDHTVSRLRDWDEWPGPEEVGCYEHGAYWQECFDALLDQAGPLREGADTFFKQLSASVRDRAKRRVPLFDAAQDAWHGPTQSVWDVSYEAGLVALYGLLGRAMPADVRRDWSWVVTGHWPCGYDRNPRNPNEPRLMVF